uniref:hypothetical protein n=1 Tax=Rheinheimera sp. TaxID=1869214 RepID=UPI0040475D67
MIKKLSLIAVLCSLCVSQACIAADTYVSGQITSLMAHGTDPAIRLSNGNAVPTKCDGGNYGWLYFEGTAEERQRIYATALALALSNKAVDVYTNGDGAQCRINNIQIILGLN